MRNLPYVTLHTANMSACGVNCTMFGDEKLTYRADPLLSSLSVIVANQSDTHRPLPHRCKFETLWT